MLISRPTRYLSCKINYLVRNERFSSILFIDARTDYKREMMKTELDTSRYELLMRAISKKVGVDEEMAGQISLRVLNYFGFEDSIIDNALDQDDRRLFYFLQDVAILKTDWEEAILPSGRTWRIFYWSLNNENIASIAMNIAVAKAQQGVYETLPADMWSREPLTQGT
jgi:hypothetical protein